MKRALAVFCCMIFVLIGCQKAEEKKSEPPQPKVEQSAPAAPAVIPEPAKAPAPEVKPATPPPAEQKSAPEKKAAAPVKELKKEKASARTEQTAPVAKAVKTDPEPQKLAKAIPPVDVPKTDIAPKKDFTGARPFSMSDIHGNTVKLSDFKGKVLAIEFSASWCPPCMKSAQNMRSIYDRFHEKGFNMCLVMYDTGKEESGNIVKKLGIPYPVLIDEGGKVSKDYGVSVIPTFILIDKQGRIVSKKTGLKAEEEITKDIEGLLN